MYEYMYNNICYPAVSGDEQLSSEDMLDLLSESADETPITENEVANTTDMDPLGGIKQEIPDGQPCAEVEDLKEDVGEKGTCYL